LELAQRSAALGLRVTVVCFDRVAGVRGRLPARDGGAGFEIRRVPFWNFVYYKPTVIPVTLLAAHDVVHVHGIGAPLDYVAFTRFRHRRPIVVSTHGGIFHTTALSRLKRLYFDRLLPLSLSRVSAVAACSRSDEALFANVSKRVLLLENGCDIESLLAVGDERRVAGRCLYVGRFSENKRVDLLLHAAAVARRRAAHFELHLVGPDAEHKRAGYETLAASLGLSDCVKFLGGLSREALHEQFACADLFVSASRYEGFGLSAIEARAAGCRLLLQRNEAFASLFGEDHAAAFTEFARAEAAGTKWADVLTRARDPSILVTRQRTRAYSWETKTAEWLKLYRTVCGEGPHAPNPAANLSGAMQ
jgi:alpha-1,3-mannosyltransferase